jgi:hypothetical protein
MRPSVFYRIAAVLMFLFDVGHTVGFRQSDPQWGVDALLTLMRSIHFPLQGFSRTYWDLYSGLGFFVTVFLLFSAALAWQIGGLPAEALARMRGITWMFALCFAALSGLSFGYFFTAPLVFTILITVCLIAAASLSSKPA